MSKRAWSYIWAVLLAAAILVGWAAYAFRTDISTGELIAFGVLTGFATISQLFEASHGKQSYYPHFVFFVAALFLLQPLLFACVVMVPHVIEWAKERFNKSEHLRDWYIQPFNIATHLLAGGVSLGITYLANLSMFRVVQSGFGAPLLPIVASLAGVVAYVVMQHAAIGQALVLARNTSWKQSGVLSWSGLQPDVIMACLGYTVAVLWQINPWLTLPALSPLVLMYQALMVPQLKQEAQTDGKTGLFNARHFSTMFQQEMERAKRFDRPVALIMADLDLLRNINNTYGHLAGDAVLGGIGQIIRETVREFDIAGRFGGEEFVIAMPEAEPEDARALAERLRASVERATFKVPNSEAVIQVTMSLGIACHPVEAQTPLELIHQADIAVYQAKLNGRNCVVCASELPHSLDLALLPMYDRLSAPYAGEFVPRPRGEDLRTTGTLKASMLNSGRLNSGLLTSGKLSSDVLDALQSGKLNSGALNSGTLDGAMLNGDKANTGRLDSEKLQTGQLDTGSLAPAAQATPKKSQGSVSSAMPAASPAVVPARAPSTNGTTLSVVSKGEGDPAPAVTAPLAPANKVLLPGTAPIISPLTGALAANTNGTTDATSTTNPISALPTTPVEVRESTQAPPTKPQPEAPTQPRGLQRAVFPMFITSVIASGLAFALTGFLTHPHIDWGAIGMFVMLAVVAELLQVDLYGRGTVSVSGAINFAAALACGIPGAALVSAAIVLAHRARQQSTLDWPAVYKTGFNWSTHLLAGVAPVLAVQLLGVPFTLDNLPLLVVPVIIASALYFVIDSSLIATVISLVAGDSPLKVWQERYRWLTGHYMVLCIMGLFLAMAYSGLGAMGVIVFTMPVLMMRFAQKQYITQTEHSVRELQRMNLELTHANAEVLAASRTMQSLNEELFLTLSKIIDARDPYVGGHASKVADYAVAIAQDLGVASHRMEPLRQAGFLHDIGKIAISETVLHKPGRLTDEEYEYIKTHAALGGEFVEMCRGLRHLAPFVRHHHERWDGKGYPDMLAAEDIPLEARILAVCDAVEAMASDRPYRKGMSLDEVIAEVKRCSGTQFDPAVAASFIRIAERERDHLVVNSAVEVQRKQAQAGDPQHPHGSFDTGATTQMDSKPNLNTGNLSKHEVAVAASASMPGKLGTGPLSRAVV